MTTWLNSIKLAPKLLSAVIFLALVSATITVIAFQSIWRVSAAVESMKAAQERTLSAGRATSNLLSYFRHVEFLPSTLSEEARRTHEAEAHNELRLLFMRIDQLEKSIVTDEGRRAIVVARDALAKYKIAHDQIASISRAGDFNRARALTLEYSTTADAVRKELRGIEERAVARVHLQVNLAKAAESSAEST
ncbi:MAG: MCP four helix bundle domain-containing protein, partial [Alphaproteobacteria bacterium]